MQDLGGGVEMGEIERVEMMEVKRAEFINNWGEVLLSS